MASEKNIDNNYQQWLAQLKEKIRTSQLNAALKVNAELLSLYWEIGRELNNKQDNAGWGDKIITQLAADLKLEFPEMKGFSRSNIFNITKWYRFYSASIHLVQQPVGLSQDPVEKAGAQIVQQAVGLLPAMLAQVPWGHHILIITKTQTQQEATFYLQQTAVNNWSRAVLQHQIESGLYKRKGNAITNFEHTLTKTQSDLARETLRNPYIFDFLGLTEDVQERELEKALILHMKKFMLELGRGFAYVGNQYNLNVEGDDFFLDLLFYNYHLHCFVVFELKVGEFKPEFAGKLNFYINTVNDQIKGKEDKPTIGVLLCKTPNETVVKYSLQGIDAPMGVSEYELTMALPNQLRGDMPTIEELEQEVDKEIEALRKPIDEKKSRLKDILEKIKGEEVKKVKDKEGILYLFDEVIWKIKEKTEIILAAEMKLFTHSYISRLVNDTANLHFTSADLEADINRDKHIRRVGLSTYFDGFKKAGTNAFGIHKELFFELEQYKYKVGERQDLIWQEYLYHHKWTEEELLALAEKWSETILDEIQRRLEQIN